MKSLIVRVSTQDGKLVNLMKVVPSDKDLYTLSVTEVNDGESKIVLNTRILSRMASTGSTEDNKTIDVGNCARCGEDHKHLQMSVLSGHSLYTHFTMCPKSCQPILIKTEDSKP